MKLSIPWILFCLILTSILITDNKDDKVEYNFANEVGEYQFKYGESIFVEKSGVNIFCDTVNNICYSAHIPEKYNHSDFSFIIHTSVGNCRIRHIQTGATFALTPCESNGVGD